MVSNILVTGGTGFLGTYIIQELVEKGYRVRAIRRTSPIPFYLPANVADRVEWMPGDILDIPALEEAMQGMNAVIHAAAKISFAATDRREMFHTNIEGTANVVNIALEQNITRFLHISSVAALSRSKNGEMVTEDKKWEDSKLNTVYGISKYAGEFWCNYFFERFGVDVRSIRYPGLISYKSAPGGGTTDYAIEIFHEAMEEKKYTCFLKEDTYLPMMYMPDAIRATIELMEAPAARISVRTAYNVAALSFSPSEIAAEIRKHIPEFTVSYVPDYRQAIANSWPQSIDDSVARTDWGWRHEYDLSRMTTDMLANLP